MKKFLPKILLSFFCFWLLAVSFLTFFPQNTFAQVQASNSGQQNNQDNQTSSDNDWILDPDVTFVGKTAIRSGDFLNWTLENYQWQYTPTNSTCQQQIQSKKWQTCTPLAMFYSSIQKDVFLFLLLFIIASAFILIITHGVNLTLKRFVLRFIIVIVLIFFSYAIIELIYQVCDIIEGIFLRNPVPSAPLKFISQDNLLSLNLGSYDSFQGVRLADPKYDESVFVNLLLVKLTAITYYTMSGILLIRKIILWFFIIISPVFPLLLFYSPIRNTAKIWVGEFFRWLLYAPLFAILLAGLVQVWMNFIPLQFNFVQQPNLITNGRLNGPIDYPTADNILVAGPGHVPTISDSANYKDSFAQYIVALLMLWVVIILPFLLLQIFLDYLQSINFAENSLVKQLIASGSNYLGKPPVPNPSPPPPASSGIARQLPFSAKMAMQIPTTANIQHAQIQNITTSSDVLKSLNMGVPTLADIAKYETGMMSRDLARHQEVSRAREALEKIGNPNKVTNPAEKAEFAQLRTKLTQEKIQGDPLASSILSAATTVSSTTAQGKAPAISPQINSELEKIRDKAGTSSVDKTQKVHAALPAINRVQTVSIEDYESVKKMWKDTYAKLDPPKTTDGKDMDRKEWIQSDIDKVTLVTNLLASADNQKMKEGMDMVAKILPFLLIGGFSQTEVLAYLKAKQEAAKEVLEDVNKKSEDEDTLLDRNEGKTEAHQQKELSAVNENNLQEPREITEADKK